MAKRKLTPDIIEELFDKINLKLVTSSIVDNGDDFTLFTDDTLHLQAGFPLTIDSVVYQITAVEYCVSVTLTGASVPVLTEFNIYKPFYFHGTILATKNEQGDIQPFDKTPMGYLMENIKDRFHNDFSTISRTSPIRIFFLSQNDWAGDTTDEHYEKVIKPMNNLLDNFINVLRHSNIIANFVKTEYNIINLTKFAEYENKTGAIKTIFDLNLGGCELQIEIDINKICK